MTCTTATEQMTVACSTCRLLATMMVWDLPATMPSSCYNIHSDKMMTKKIWSLLLACLLLTACDEGKIYPEQPAEHDVYVAMNTALKGLNAWPRNYLIVLASFGDNDREPLSTAVILIFLMCM